ncbi:hypothetical protein [Arthrobacter sp. CP30]
MFWVVARIVADVVHLLIPAGPQETWTTGTYAGASISALRPIAALGASLVFENVLIAREVKPSAEPADTLPAEPPAVTVPLSAASDSGATVELGRACGPR